jgi:uncharacterized RDD family membrane protein YckC
MTTAQRPDPGILTQDAPAPPSGGGATREAAAAEPAGVPDPRPPFAHWWRRVAASLLDGWVVATVTFLCGGPFDTSWGANITGKPRVQAPTAVWWVCVAVLLVLQAYTGATPGKRAMGISIVREVDGRPLGLLRTIGREVAHFVDMLCLIGYLRPLWHRRRRTFADSLASSDALLTRAPRPHRAVEWLAAHRVRLLPGAVATALAGAVCTVAVLALPVTRTTGTGADATCQGDPSIQASATGGAVLGDIGPTADGGWTESTTGVDVQWLHSPTPRLLEARLITGGWTSERRLGIERRRTEREEPQLWWAYGGPVRSLTAVLGPARADADALPDEARSVHVRVAVDMFGDVGEASSDGGSVRVVAVEPGIVGVTFVPDEPLVTDEDFAWRAAVEPAAGTVTTCGLG